jgi:hypothetical protein
VYSRSLILPHGAGVASLSVAGSTIRRPRRRDTSNVNSGSTTCVISLPPCSVADACLTWILTPLLSTNSSPPIRYCDHSSLRVRDIGCLAVDPNEVAFRVVIGQQVSTTGARRSRAPGRPDTVSCRFPVGSVTDISHPCSACRGGSR